MMAHFKAFCRRVLPVSFLKRWRSQALSHIIILDLEKLYNFTLNETSEIRPWACDKNGKFIMLQARYDFVKLFLSKGDRLSDNEVKATSYYKIISQPLEVQPRAGGAQWVYGKPMAQARRFMALIRSLKKNGYVRSKNSCVLDEFCDTSDPHVAKHQSGEIKVVNYKGRSYEGLMTVKPHRDFYSVWNGNHRLAILMVFWEKGYLKDKNIPVFLVI